MAKYQFTLSIECEDDLDNCGILKGPNIIYLVSESLPDFHIRSTNAIEFMKENPSTLVETAVWIRGGLISETSPTKTHDNWVGTLPVMRLDYNSVKDCAGSEENFQALLQHCPPVQTLESLLTKKKSWIEDGYSDSFCWIEESLLQAVSHESQFRLNLPCDREQLEKLLCDLKDYIRNLLVRFFGVVV